VTAIRVSDTLQFVDCSVSATVDKLKCAGHYPGKRRVCLDPDFSLTDLGLGTAGALARYERVSASSLNQLARLTSQASNEPRECDALAVGAQASLPAWLRERLTAIQPACCETAGRDACAPSGCAPSTRASKVDQSALDIRVRR